MGAVPHFRERLWPSPVAFVSTILVIPAATIVFLPIAPAAGAPIGVVLYGAIVALFLVSTPTLEVDDHEFRAGKARLPRTVVAEVSAHREKDATLERGQLLDARAWLLIRGWISPVVKVRLNDPDDPTPYWLISTRHPDQLVAALRR